VAKRSAQLDAEIREALRRIDKKPGLKTREQLDDEIDAVLAGGLGAERYEVARALGYQYPKRPPPKKISLTGTNLFALKEQVLMHGSSFPNRFYAVDRPHLKRCVTLGLCEVSGNTMYLTRIGKQLVGDELIKDLEREGAYEPKENTLVKDPALRAKLFAKARNDHQATIARIEAAIESLGR